MLADAPTFSNFSVNDLSKAKAFYADTLGLVAEESEFGTLSLKLAGGEAMLYPKPDHQPATFTVLNFSVTDIGQAVADLAAKGVSFEHYDQDMLKTDDRGISVGDMGPKMAWFKDPAGNILALMQPPAGK